MLERADTAEAIDLNGRASALLDQCFTLIELLLLIAIISIRAGLILRLTLFHNLN